MHVCNFLIFLINYRIIEPLTSRCSKFRFKPLHDEILVKKLKEICGKESVLYQTGVRPIYCFAYTVLMLKDSHRCAHAYCKI